MIHLLAERYGQCLNYVRDNYCELDFWEMACLNSVESANIKARQNNA